MCPLPHSARFRAMWTTIVRCAADLYAFCSMMMMAKLSAMPMDWETADRLDELEVRMPDILVIPSFPCAALPLRVFAENAFGCLQKQKLSLLSENPAIRSLVDGSLTNRLISIHTHENRYPHPHRFRCCSFFLPADPTAAASGSDAHRQVSCQPLQRLVNQPYT